jgi:N-acetylmuramoyl-L-alanine amidase
VTDSTWPPTDHATVLACTLWMECRSGGNIGMQSIANVVCNRVAKPGWWGTDIRSVCLAPEQFSSWNEGSTQVPLVQEAIKNGDPSWSSALFLAQEAISGDLADITDGSTLYYDTSIDPPYWAKPPAVFTVEISGQRFYREGDSSPKPP